MLSATSRIALLPIARSTRLCTAILTPRSTRARRLTTTATTVHGYDTLPLSDAQRKTIYALSTPPGKSGVAVIRVSGPEALSVWQRMVRSVRGARLPEPWKLERCHILDPHTSETLDEALSVFFRGAPAHRNQKEKLPSLTNEWPPSSRVYSAPLVHYRRCAGVTRAWRARGRRRGSCRARTRARLPSCHRGRVHASCV